MVAPSLDAAATPDSPPPGDGPARARRRPRRRTVVLVAVAVVVLLLAWGGWVAWRATQVAGALEGARPLVGRIETAVRAGDVDGALVLVPELRERGARAVAATSDPAWRLAEHLPVVGDDLAAVSGVADAYALVTRDVVPRLAQAADVLAADAFAPRDGRVDLAPVVAAADDVTAAAASARAAVDLVPAADDGLLEQVATRVAGARAMLVDAARTLTGASDALAVLPGLLGAEGERAYLVLVLNPAELRSGGGLAGAGSVLRAHDGVLELVDHRASPAFGRYDEPVLPLTEEEVAVHGDRLGRYVQNVTGTPHFPRTAELAAAMWERDTGTAVDGVLAVDPVALAAMLEVVGPVTEPTGTVLAADDAVRTLLLETYRVHPDPEDADAFYAGVAATVLGALLHGDAEPAPLLAALADAVDARRLLVWSRDADEQRVLGASPAGGAFLGEGAADAGGVFLDDVTGTKLGYFLRADVEATPATCAAWPGLEAADDVTVVTLTLTSEVPAEVSALPAYVSGEGFADAPGRLRTNLTVYSPVGGEVVGVRRGDATLVGLEAAEAGRDVAVVTSDLGPGESETWHVALRGDGAAPSEVWRTPTLRGAARVAVGGCA